MTRHNSIARFLSVFTRTLALSIFAATFLAGVAAFGQIDTGNVTGTVQDPTGAAVPGAQVTLTNPQTGTSQATTSTATGTYSFTGVRPGLYDLKASAPGFAGFTAQHIEVHIQQTATLDVKLATGAVSQNVDVTAAAPLLQAETAEVGQTVSGEAVNDLPLQSRNWASLSQLAPGVTTAPSGQPSGDSGSATSAFFVVNGANLWQNDFRLNGINDNIEMYGGASVNSNAAITPPPDALQEFRLQADNMSAEFGHSTGAVVNATTKSGTNHFHGDIWEYVRNDIFNANLLFNRINNKPRPEYRQNIFGATIGGPIVRDHTFFFFAYEGQRYVLPSPYTGTVPTNAMRNSGYTNLQDLITYNSGTGTDALGRVFPHGTVLDPATTRTVAAHAIDPVTGLTNNSDNTIYVRDPFYAGSLTGVTNFVGQTAQLNTLPAGRLDPNAIKLLNVYPTPTGTGLSSDFYWVPKQTRNINRYDVRIDHTFNAHNVINGTFDRQTFDWSVPPNLPGLAVGQGGARNDSFPAYSWTVSYTHTFTPTLINEMHVGMIHADKLQRSIYGNQFGIPASFGINGVPQVAENGGLSPTYINGLTGLGVGNYTPTLQYVYSLQGADKVTKDFRNHSFKAGVEVLDIIGNISQPPQGRGDFNFNGQYTDVPNANSSLTGIAELLLTPVPSTVPNGVDYVGGMSSFSGSNVSGTDDQRWYYAVYFQDDWKITPTFTANLGLRWDYFSPYEETRGRQANFVPTAGNSAPATYYIPNKGCSVPRSAGFDALLAGSNIALKCTDDMRLGNAQKGNVGPRIGFEYRVRPNLVARAGYGITYGALGNLGYGGTLGTNYPFVYVTTYNSPDTQHPIALPDGSPAATLEHTFAAVNIGDPTLNPGTGLNLYGRQYNFQTPMIQAMNLAVQYQFSAHDSAQIGYVGNVGRHLDNLGYNNSPSQILPPGVNAQNYIPFPSFARNATYETTNATSSYNSMQAEYQRDMRNGLSVIANYTWSKCMTDQHTQAEQNQQYRAEWLPGWGIKADYGLCDTDSTNVTHLSGTYHLPFGHGQKFMGAAGHAVDAVVGGWTANAIYSYQTGQPVTVTCPTSTSAFGCFANKVPGVDIYGGKHNIQQWLNPAAFAQPPVATAVGQSSYAPLGGEPMQARGPHYTNLDVSLLKDVRFTESIRIQLRAEAFNVTNTSPLGQPTNLGSFTNTATFAQITGERNSSDANRRLQFAFKLFY